MRKHRKRTAHISHKRVSKENFSGNGPKNIDNRILHWMCLFETVKKGKRKEKFKLREIINFILFFACSNV
jgi:hypothetical protein